MAANQYFQFLSAVIDNLPSEDRDKFAELYKGYEQVFASAYQKWNEDELNTAVSDLQPYSTERWLPYDFTDENSVNRVVTYTSNQDISGGVNLSQRWLIKFSVDNGAPIEVDLRGANPVITTLPEIVQRINNVAGFNFARGVFENSLIQFSTLQRTPVASITFYPASVPARDASEFVLGILPQDLPVTVPEFPHVYSTPYPDDVIVSIPTMQDAIRDDGVEQILTEGVDFILEKELGTISFKNVPKEVMWARRTLIDLETPWNNFGFLMDIYDENSPGYLNVVQGLWFAFWTGPKPSNIRSSLYLLFGLPVAPEEGTVTQVTTTSIQILGSVTGELFEFEIPDDLSSLVSVGDEVLRFQPLVTGIDVFDKINSPGFIEREIGRAGIQRFLLDDASRGSSPDTDETKALAMLEEHTFLPQISVEAFISPDINLSNVKNFLNDIKPLNKTFLFQVIVGRFTETIRLIEKLAIDVSLDVTPNLDSNQTTFAEQAVLDAYEGAEDLALNLDSDVIGMDDFLEIEVYDKNGFVESFIA